MHASAEVYNYVVYDPDFSKMYWILPLVGSYAYKDYFRKICSLC